MDADYFLFSERFAVLADGHPGDDREALRSFAVLHDVRRIDLVYTSSSYHFPMLCPAMPNLYNRIGYLRRSYRRLLFQRMLCIYVH